MRRGVDPRPVGEGGRAESLRVDVFELLPASTPDWDWVWWLGWVTLLVQIVIAIIPWAIYGDWSIALVTFSGSLLALITCAMPQWIQEKWTARRADRPKVTCLTNGNGSHHIMVFIASQGAWDMEQLAASSSTPRSETKAMVLGLSVLWTCLLISVSGIQYHTWYLVCVGGIGMLQNLFAAGAPRVPVVSNFDLRRSSRVPAIIGLRQSYKDEANADVNLNETDNGLAELSLWAFEETQARMPSVTGEKKDQSRRMPRWLESMSREDGVPDWLVAVRPQAVAASADSEAQPSSILTGLFQNIRKCREGNHSAQESTVYVKGGVHGALIELEKWVPTAGLAMLGVFFPQGLAYNDQAVRDNIHKRFWRQASHTKGWRWEAEMRRGEEFAVGAVTTR